MDWARAPERDENRAPEQTPEPVQEIQIEYTGQVLNYYRFRITRGTHPGVDTYQLITVGSCGVTLHTAEQAIAIFLRGRGVIRRWKNLVKIRRAEANWTRWTNFVIWIVGLRRR